MEEGSEVMEDIVFRGVEFTVKVEVDKGLLIVEISDSVTADQWRSEFNPACKYNTFIINLMSWCRGSWHVKVSKKVLVSAPGWPRVSFCVCGVCMFPPTVQRKTFRLIVESC